MTMPFGLRLAPKIFAILADAVMWVLRQQGVEFVIHYYASQLAIDLNTFDELGLLVAMNKVEGPMPCLTFLGFELDSIAMRV